MVPRARGLLRVMARVPPAVVFLDFDGTITVGDVTDAVLERFAEPAWLEIERAWVAGEIGSRDCLARQMALVTATGADIDRLLDDVAVDPGLVPLLDACAARAVPVHIVSDGFDCCIRRILGRPELAIRTRLAGSEIVSSVATCDGARWRAAFPHPAAPCVHGCATCKPLAMERLRGAAAITMFAGDGLSDRHAAACADVVFAKKSLAAHCERAAIPYMPYQTLADVAAGLGRLLDSGAARAPSGKAFHVL